jgi:hypothetical protein
VSCACRGSRLLECNCEIEIVWCDLAVASGEKLVYFGLLKMKELEG